METKALILIIEDEAIIRNFMFTSLVSNGYRVISATNGQEGIELCLNHAPQAVLLDLGLPDMDGLQVLNRLKERCDTPVIIVSARGQEQDKVEALDDGADDYIVKPFGSSELMARIRTALRHSSLSAGLSRALFLKIGELEIDFERRKVSLNGDILHLTPIEYKILALLARNPGKVLTHDAIIKEIWGSNLDESHTLRVNMANIRRKIEINPGAPRYILTEVGVGYRMAENAENDPSART